MKLPNAKAAGSDPAESGTQVPPRSGDTVVSMNGITRRFGHTVALDSVDFAVRAGAIQALLGENGAGKSTLMHVLAGLIQPDQGSIVMNGRTVRIDSPRRARALGIAMVHQHFTLVPAFTVAENLALDTPDARRRFPPAPYLPGSAAARALERAASLGWALDPEAHVAELSVGVQQRVEIVKALATDANVIIFDEPTAVLTGSEVEELFQVLRILRDRGHAIVLIAHKLAEILAVCDRVSVLRRGRNVAECRVSETDAKQLARWMVGTADQHVGTDAGSSGAQKSDSSDALPTTPARESEPLVEHDSTNPPPVERTALVARDLVVAGDRGEKALNGLSMDVLRGEIYGIGGVDGNGQVELAEVLTGLRAVKSGLLTWDGRPFIAGVRPRTGYIPQDRRHSGLAVSMSIRDNLLFDAVRAPRYRMGPFLKRRALDKLALSLVSEFDIRTPDSALPVSTLSGGNQQKVVVARALHASPELIVAMNPTRGLDFGATAFVHTQLRRAKESGAAVVLISTDLDEIAALADRASIISQGTLTDFRHDAESAEHLGLLLGGIREDTA